jgi:predicted Zn-dependent peptidase
MVISLAGALPANVVDLIQPYWEKFEGKKIVHKQPHPDIKGGISLKKKKTEQTHLCLGTKGVSQLDEDRFGFAILDTIMGGSMSSHLFQEVREKRGLAYAIYSTSSPFRDLGIAYTYAGIGNENLEQVVDLILKEFGRMKQEGLTSGEIERAKEYMKGTTVLGLESTAARMSYIMRSEFYYDRIVTIDEVFDKIDKVTNDDIIRLANQYFRDEYLTLAVIGDIEELPIKELKC